MTILKKIYNNFNEKFCKRVTNSQVNLEKYNKLFDYCKNKNRCFILGNGPSLTLEDINLLQNEIVFVSNRFFNFCQSIVPTAYFCQDPTVLKNNIGSINENIALFTLINPNLKIKNKIKYKENTIYYYIIKKLYFSGQKPKISSNFCDGFYDGYTVTYSMLQIAIALGFKEIYLLGVDFNYLVKNGKIDDSSYPKGMTKTNGGGLPDVDYNLLAFQTAKEYCDKNGIKVTNLSRNTKLEVFERKSLETIL